MNHRHRVVSVRGFMAQHLPVGMILHLDRPRERLTYREFDKLSHIKLEYLGPVESSEPNGAYDTPRPREAVGR